jgi:hypothetical protein
MNWDVFISHASEDKRAVALPLAQLLSERGVKVWIDAHELKLGDSLRARIDEGLANSTWGLVVLSPAFFRKPWFQAEVDALVSREIGGQRVLLPVWHDVTAADLARISPLLAARLGVSTADGLEHVCDAILSAMGRGGPTTAASKACAFEDAWFASFSSPERQQAGVLDISNRRLGPFLIQQQIGRGGSGIVFRALHVPLGKTVAVKVLYPLDDQTSAVTRAAERGLRGLASVRHPCVLSPLDFGYLRSRDRTSLFIATDLVDGTDIVTWSCGLRGSGALQRRIDVALKLSEGIQAAHDCRFVGDLGFEEQGVLHGDIKPDNILVERASDRPLLVDFMIPDIQRLLHRFPIAYSYWRKDADGEFRYRPPLTAAYGTPGFMPPEQEIDGMVLETSDIYSLGMTLARVFWPLDTRDNHEMQSLDSDAQLLAEQSRSRDREAALTQLIQAMTSANAKDRPQQMQDVLHALRAV